MTLPLLVEQLNNDYKTAAAFTAAAILALMAVLTLILKSWLERRVQVRQGADGRDHPASQAPDSPPGRGYER